MKEREGNINKYKQMIFTRYREEGVWRGGSDCLYYYLIYCWYWFVIFCSDESMASAVISQLLQGLWDRPVLLLPPVGNKQRKTSGNKERKQKGEKEKTHVKHKIHEHSLPYIPRVIEPIQRAMKKHQIHTAVKLYSKLRQLLVHPKDNIEQNKKCNVIYKIPCQSCNKTYIGEYQKTGTQERVQKNDHRAG